MSAFFVVIVVCSILIQHNAEQVQNCTFNSELLWDKSGVELVNTVYPNRAGWTKGSWQCIEIVNENTPQQTAKITYDIKSNATYQNGVKALPHMRLAVKNKISENSAKKDANVE